MRLSDPFVCQNPRGVYVCHSTRPMLGYAYTNFFRMVKLKFFAQFPDDRTSSQI